MEPIGQLIADSYVFFVLQAWSNKHLVVLYFVQ